MNDLFKSDSQDAQDQNPEQEIKSDKPWWYNKSCSYCGNKDNPIFLHSNNGVRIRRLELVCYVELEQI